jgi:hypothetical protein F3_00887|nr:MAG TPA: hypothetical protein [Caudoviricetes sp.]
MEKETVLEIAFMPIWDKWAWKIIKQNEEVLVRDVFLDKEIGVMSDGGSPDFVKDTNYLFIRDFSKTEDNKINICSSEEKALIEDKVKAINEKYGILKRWRANKYDHYHFLGNVFEIQESVEMGFVEDIERYQDGNYFRTKEEAEKYRDYIVRKSLEWHEKRGRDE